MGQKIHRIKKRITGFTLVELLVVLGILVVLFMIALVAINPFEILNKAQDVATQTVAKDYATAAKIFYTQEKKTIWSDNSTCQDELSTQNKLSEMPSCIEVLTQGGTLQEKVVESRETDNIFTTQCNDSLALCHRANSSEFKNNPDAKYTSNGAINPDCPGGDECYICTFTTNEAEECFQAMQPNILAQAPADEPGQILPIIERNSTRLCNEPQDGFASCMADIVTDSSGNPLSTFRPPNGFTPEHLHKAYNLPCTPNGPVDHRCDTPATFGPQTVAVILAFHAPTIEQDLNVYSQTYGLPPCTTANGCLTIVNQNGQTSPLPTQTDPLWALEAALDVQMAHAICQTCKVLLVEANSNTYQNLGVATRTAAQMGATVISNSYGGREWSGASFYDQYYDHPGIGVTAATGDWGYGAYYPAASNKVISVGGTSLSIYSDFSYGTETVWSGTGGGCSGYQQALTIQTSLPNWSATGCGTRRSIADVAAVADPATGVAIYNSNPFNGRTGWWILGGTSASSPIYAAALALDGGVPSGVDGVTIPYQNTNKFRDVTVGSNGSCGNISCTAGIGYDGPTGLGSPNLLASSDQPPDVTQPQTSTTPTPVSPCSAPPTVTLSSTKKAMPGDIMNTSLFITNNDPSSCTSIFTISYETPSGWVITTIPTEKTIKGGVFTSTNFDTIVPFSQANGIYNLNFSIKKDNLSTIYTANMPVEVIQNIPPPTSIIANADKCTANTTMTLQSYIIPGIPGLPASNTLSIKNNNAQNCSNVYHLTYSQTNFSQIPTWKFNGIPPSITLSGGETQQVPFTMSASENGLVAGNYIYNIWATRKDGTSNYPNGVTTGRVQVQQTGSGSATSTPTPTISQQNCNNQQTVTLQTTDPIIALPGDTVNNVLTVKDNNQNCTTTYTISQSYPTGWGLSGIPASFTLNGGEIKSIPFTMTVPQNATAGNFGYQFWVARQGQSSVNPVNGSVQVAQVGPTNTPTPTPVNCFQGWSNSLGSTSLSGNAGDTINQSITITYNNPPSCGTASFAISHSYPSGWVINGLPPSVQLTGGESKTIPFTITISTGAQIQDYLMQYWVNSGGTPMNATVHVIGTSQPPEEQLFSNFNAKMYGDYALFEYSYNATGAVSGRLDVATDPSALEQTTGPNSAGYYGFAFNSGGAMDSSNSPKPSSVRGFIKKSPSFWSGWQCGDTIYYRMYNSGDLRIKSPIQSGVVDCNTQIDVLPWEPWYQAIYYGVYDQRYDPDNSGTVNWDDYWILVRATRLR